MAQRAYPAPFPAWSFAWMSTSKLTLDGAACGAGCLRGVCFFLAGEDRQQIVQRVAVPQPVKADVVAPALRADGDGFTRAR